MSIKNTYMLLATFFSLLLMLSVMLFIDMKNHSNHIWQLEKQHTDILMFGQELKDSYQTLLRFAREYSMSGEEKYRLAYQQLMDIRRGKIERPEKFSSLYWYLPESYREKHHSSLKLISDGDIINQLPLDSVEKEGFLKIEQQFEKLDNLISPLMEYKPISSQSRLFDSTLIEGKIKSIVIPLDLLLLTSESKFHERIKLEQQEYQKHYDQQFLLLFFAVGLIICFFINYHQKILHPVLKLTDTIKSFKCGYSITTFKHNIHDEIGQLIRQFFWLCKKTELDYHQMKQLSMTDNLTKIPNRHSFYETYEQIILLSARNNKKFCLMMLDIDHFKNINDQFGHLIGDKALIHVVNQINQSLRRSDIFARFGGEEFVVLLPETSTKGGLIIAEKIRSAIELNYLLILEHGIEKKISLSISIGIAEYSHIDRQDSLLSRVDDALYKAKNNGRNQIWFSESDGIGECFCFDKFQTDLSERNTLN